MSKLTSSIHGPPHHRERAVIILRNGYVYEGPAHIADGFVHCDAQRKIGSGDDARYMPVGVRSWAVHWVREIRWTGQGNAAA
jgi:hypothetical protein